MKRADEKDFIDYLPGNSFTTKADLNEQQKKALEFIKLRILGNYGSTGVQQCLDKAVFELLGNIVVYPVEDDNKLTDSKGNVLPDVYLMPKGSTALDIAFKVHSDLGDRFICAIDVRTKRRLGKNYELKNNDVIKIMISK